MIVPEGKLANRIDFRPITSDCGPLVQQVCSDLVGAEDYDGIIGGTDFEGKYSPIFSSPFEVFEVNPSFWKLMYISEKWQSWWTLKIVSRVIKSEI